MKKLLLTFLIAFITALGANAKDYYTVLFGSDYNSKSVQSYENRWYVTCNGTRWDLANFNNNQNGWSYVKCGSKQKASVATITSSAALPEKISSVTVTIDAIATKNVNSISLTVADDAQFKTNAATYTAAKLATGDLPFTIDKPAANKFYKLTFDCKKSSNGVIQISKVVFSGNDDLPTSCEAPTFNFEENAEVTTGDVIKATCTTDNSTVYLKVGDGEFEQTDSYPITKSLATGPLKFEAYATVQGKDGIIESDHTSLNVNVVKKLGDIMYNGEAVPATISLKGGETLTFTSANAVSMTLVVNGDEANKITTLDTGEISWTAPAAKESEQTVRLKVVSKLGTDTKEAYVTVTVQKKAEVGDGFVLITDANNLSDGMEFYIVNKSQSDTFVMGAERYKDEEKTESYNNRYAISGATIQDNILTPADGYSLIKLVDTNSIDKDNKKLWNLSVDEGYLCASSSSRNYLNTTDDPTDGNAKATISFDNSGNAIITFSGSYTRNTIRKNSNDEIFSCYSSTTQKAVKIYGRQAAPSVKVPGDVTSEPAAVEGVITINKDEEITFSSKDAAKLQVSTQLEPVVGSSYKYIPTEEGVVTITPIDSEGKVYTEKAATFTIKFFKGLVDGTISYKTNTFTYTIGSEATLPELVKEPADVDVEYSISHERVENGVAVYHPATIDEQGNITVNTPGIVRVTATVKADRAKTASYVLEIQSLKEAETSASTVKAPVVHITGGNVYYSPDGEWYWGTEDESHELSFANETDGAQIYYTMTSATPSSANVRAMANSATDTLYSTPFKKSDLDGKKITFWAEKDDQKSAVETLNFNIKTGIEDIDVENAEAIEEEGDARYFNLQGLEVKNPGEGIYIRVANGKATKILKK